MAACKSYSGGPKVGADNFFYINSGTVNTPVWLVFGEITDLAVDDFSLNVAELKRRSNDFTKNVAALFNSITVSFRLVHGLDKGDYDFCVARFRSRGSFMAMVSDGDATDATANNVEVLTLPLLLTAFPWDQPLEDIGGHDVTCALAYYCDDTPVTPLEVDPSYQLLDSSITAT